MRILYICRTFTGFTESVLAGRWRPAGAPTIYKMIEALDRGPHQPRFMFTAHGADRTVNEIAGREIRIDGLRHAVLVSGGETHLPRWLGRLRPHFADLLHWFAIFREYRRFRPDIVYVDRMNAVAGALLARLLGARVVLRIMGIYPDMWDIHHTRRPSAMLQKWAFRQNFTYAICTNDGTDGTAWMKASLASVTPRVSLLNGVQLASPDGKLVAELRSRFQGRMLVLFVGRFEPYKGCEEFVDAMLALRATHRDRIHGVMVGTGSLSQTLARKIENSGASDCITLLGSVPHQDIGALLQVADVYVSLNKLGNMSNANLEAMRTGLCMIVPEPDEATGADRALVELLPADAAIRLPRADLVNALVRELIALEAAPNLRASMVQAVQRHAASRIWDWDERIAREIDLLVALAEGRKP